MIRSQMAHSQLCDLARATGCGILMTFPAGLRIVEWSKAIGYALHLVELNLIGLMCWIIDYTVAFVVEPCGRIWRRLTHGVLVCPLPTLRPSQRPPGQCQHQR